MTVDKVDLLWLIAREEQNPGALPSGSALRMEAAHLDDGQGQPAALSVSRALAELRRQGWIDWVFYAWPNRPKEPLPHLIDDITIQQISDVSVTDAGYRTAASRRPSPTQQINIIHSTVGQLALGDVSNIDFVLILEAAERCLADLDAPEEAKLEARGTIQRMRESAASIATGAAGSLIAEALRTALGLP